MTRGRRWLSRLADLRKQPPVCPQGRHGAAHRFRHTFASEFYRRHKDLLALRNLLGHTKIEVTERYLRSLGVEYGTTEYMSPDDWLK